MGVFGELVEIGSWQWPVAMEGIEPPVVTVIEDDPLASRDGLHAGSTPYAVLRLHGVLIGEK